MNQELTVYFENKPQRIEILDDKEYWNAQDACRNLGLENVTKALKRVPIEHITESKVLAADGKIRLAKHVDEAGLNYLISGSQKDEALRYKEWAFGTVLPSIRRTGTYSIKPLSQIEILKQSLAIIGNHEQRIAALETQRAVTAALPPVQQITPRLQISRIARGFADKYKIEYKRIFNDLYREFKYRYHIDLKAQAENQKSSPMDIAERLGRIQDLLSLTVHLFIEGNYHDTR